jgi:hypothetical protein
MIPPVPGPPSQLLLEKAWNVQSSRFSRPSTGLVSWLVGMAAVIPKKITSARVANSYIVKMLERYWIMVFASRTPSRQALL